MKITSTKTKLLAGLLTLCMVLSLVPFSVFAASPATETAYFAAPSAATETADFTTGGGTAAIKLLNQYKTGSADSLWDNNTKTLTLWGVNFTTTAQTAVKLPAGTTIVLKDGTHNTIQSGDVTLNVSGDYKNQTFINALDAAGSLTIQGGTAGTGTLSVFAGKVNNSGNAWTYSSGIAVNGDFTVKGGHVTARGGRVQVIGEGSSAFSIGVNMDNDIKNKALLVTGGTLTAIAGEAYRLQDANDTNPDFHFSRGVYLYRGNVTVSGNGGLRAESVEKMSKAGILSNGLYISVGDLILANSAEVAAAGGEGVYISGGNIRMEGGRLQAVSTQAPDTYGNLESAVYVAAENKKANTGNITVSGGTLETNNGKIYMSVSGTAENQGVFTVTGGTVMDRGQLNGAKSINISGGSVQSQGIDADALTLSGGTLTVRESVRKNDYSGELWANPAVDVSTLTVSGGTLDVAWSWGEFEPIVFPVNDYYGYATSLVQMPREFHKATFTGGTTTLDTGIAGNTALLINGTLTLGDGMTETGADSSHRQLKSDIPVKFAAAVPSITISSAVVENAKFDYQPGDAPQATAAVAAADADKYEIVYECWQQFENNEPVAAWYSDNDSHGSLPTITEFESGKKYVYSIMLKPKDGYSFSNETVVTVNGQRVSAPFVGGSMYIPSIKTITPTKQTPGTITSVDVENVKLDYQPGSAPQPTARRTGVDQDKYDILYECWGKWEKDADDTLTTVAYWYSDESCYSDGDVRFNTFEKGGRYQYSVRFKAKDGYVFDSNLSKENVTLNGTSLPFGSWVNVLDDGKTCLITYGTETRPGQTVEAIRFDAVINFDAGDKPRFSSGVVDPIVDTDHQRWDANDGSGYGITSSEFWNNRYNGKLITEFEDGKSYTYGVYFKISDLGMEEGYRFDKNTKLYINGTEITLTPDQIDVDDNGETIWFSNVLTMTPTPVKSWQKIDVIEIDGATISFKVGDKPVFTGKTPENAPYIYQFECWETKDGAGVNSAKFFDDAYEKHITAFENGETYQYILYLKAKDGYYFTADTKIKINGTPYSYRLVNVDPDYDSSGRMYTFWAYTDLTMTPQASGTTPGDGGTTPGGGSTTPGGGSTTPGDGNTNPNKDVKTGDNNNLALWFALLFVSGGVLTGVMVLGKKKRFSVR